MLFEISIACLFVDAKCLFGSLLDIQLLELVFVLPGLFSFFDGEFDPGSGRTLAACLTHASRTVTMGLAPSDQWRTGE